jgi:ABC-type uncharacterized transport system YnjBCD permease subunit
VALYVLTLWILIPYTSLFAGIAVFFLLLRQTEQWTDVAVAILETRLRRAAV